MLKATLLRFTNYNLWANDQLLTLIDKEVKNGGLDKEIISSFSSLRKTIYHIWDAEYIWLRRFHGESLFEWPGKSFNGTFTSAKEKMLLNSRAFIDYVETKNDEELLIPMTYQNTEGKTFSNPRWESVFHCMNHSTYHRGQAVTILRQLGVNNVPSTDYITFCRVKK